MHEIELLKIHRNRYNTMAHQRAHYGKSVPTHMITEMRDIERQIENIEDGLRRRLNSLRSKMAIQGINSDPALSIEVEDIEKYFDSYKPVESKPVEGNKADQIVELLIDKYGPEMCKQIAQILIGRLI